MAAGLAWLASPLFWSGIAVGLFGGAVSGLLGVSSGGVLVPALALALSLDQHRAQAVSLVAQVLPTSLPGVWQYARRGHGAPWAWIAACAVGFLAGGYVGALGAGMIANAALQWMYVGYLVLLGVLTFLRRSHEDDDAGNAAPAPVRLLLAVAGVGFAGGASSGLLGIGGGLAMTALLVGTLGVTQHRAHALSLAVTALPVGLPAVWVYAQHEQGIPWLVVTGVVVGLAIGTVAGARYATALPERRLRALFVGLIAVMALAMAGRAAGWW